MLQQRVSIHGEWSSRLAFILAATGAAVGLGNVWKFPYIAGENGGGAFVLIYLVCIVVIGVPVMMAEILIGRRGRRNPADSIRLLALESGRSRHWYYVGYLIILAGFLILSYYSVIAGWALDYVFQAISGDFKEATPKTITSLFHALVNNPFKLIFWHTLIIFSTVTVVARGVQQGLEKAIRYLFPGMLGLLLLVVAYSYTTGHFMAGVHFLFHPDFAKLTSNGALIALGHAFFTLSLATGSIMMYGAYLPQDASVTKASVMIAFADTAVALIAGLAIFPIVLANGLEPSAGPGLIFQTLPIAFGHMPYGTLFATIFFVMLVFAAFTSAISLLEPTVAWLMETFEISRFRAAWGAGLAIWLLGFATAFSFNIWSHVMLFHLDIFKLLDYLTANIMLPLGGLFIAIFSVWLMRRDATLEELQLSDGYLYKKWRFVLRYITPVAIVVIFLDFTGIL